MDDAIAANAGVVVFLDCTKLGRIAAKELDAHMDMIQKVLVRRQQASVAFVMAPIYSSERVGNTLRSEAPPQKCLIHFLFGSVSVWSCFEALLFYPTG